MKTTRRHVLRSIAVLPLVATAAEDPQKPERLVLFMGSWFVTSAATSLILSVEPQGEALFLFIENGAFSILRTTWKALGDGVLIEGFPRIRLWPGTTPENVRAEMEPLPEDMEASAGFRRFPRKFFMRRAVSARLGRDLEERPLPAGWDKPAREAEEKPQ